MTREQAERLAEKLLKAMNNIPLSALTRGYLKETFIEAILQFEVRRIFAGLPVETAPASEELTLEEVLRPLTWRECAKLLYLRTQVQREATEKLKAQIKALSERVTKLAKDLNE